MSKVKNEVNKQHSKKEFRKIIGEKIKAAVPELMLALSEKKLESRIKKAVKILTEDLPKEEIKEPAKKVAKVAVKAAKATTAEQVVAKKTGPKKVVAKA